MNGRARNVKIHQIGTLFQTYCKLNLTFYVQTNSFLNKQTKKRQRLSMQNSCIIYFQPIDAPVGYEDFIFQIIGIVIVSELKIYGEIYL